MIWVWVDRYISRSKMRLVKIKEASQAATMQIAIEPVGNYIKIQALTTQV